MKALNYILFLGFIISMLLSSCSIEKRQYLSGYYIDGLSHKKATPQLRTNSPKTKPAIKSQWEEPFELSKENKLDISTISASIDNNTIEIIKPTSIKFNKQAYQKIGIAETDSISEYRVDPFEKSEFKKDNRKLSILAIIGLSAAIMGIVLMLLFYWTFFLGSAAIVLSSIALGKTGKEKKKGRGFAIAGLTLGILLVVTYVLIVISVLFVFMTFFGA